MKILIVLSNGFCNGFCHKPRNINRQNCKIGVGFIRSQSENTVSVKKSMHRSYGKSQTVVGDNRRGRYRKVYSSEFC